MASTIVPTRADEATRAAFISTLRGKLTLDAAWEVSAIATALQRKFSASSCPVEDLAFRALSIRLERLASIMMTCIDDPEGDIEDARCALEGPELTRQRFLDQATNGKAAT